MGLCMTLSAADAPSIPRIGLRQVMAVGLGNALEFYDFLTFSFFAVQIGHCFFPDTGAGGGRGLLYSLATFGVGFVTRPLGGWVIGLYADRAGRRPAMLLTFVLMGAAMTGLALTPSYAQIGIAAPILLVLFRLLQGFALGGEVGPSTAFLVEAAPPHRRGIYVALQYATQDVAVLVAGIMGYSLSQLMTPADLDAYGWRIAFLAGVAVVPVGLYIRRGLPETLHDTDGPAVAADGQPVSRRIVILGLMLLGAGTIGSYVSDYITTYAQDSLHLAPSEAFGATIIVGLFALIGEPISGLVSDRFGRKTPMLTGGCVLILSILPCFTLMVSQPNTATVYAVSGLLSFCLALMTAPALITITEALPRRVRSRALGTLYAVAIATFGGSTQVVVKALIDWSGSPMAPAWYWSGALVFGLTAAILVPETAPIRAAQGASRIVTADRPGAP